MKTTILYKSTGVLNYSNSNGYRLALDIDQGIADFYRNLIPKHIQINRPRWPAHTTVVRAEKEIPKNLDVWGKYQDQSIDFWYSPTIHHGKIYFWLNTFCVRLEDIRRELGLPVVSQYTLPPAGFTKCFHMTIANQKTVD